MIHNGQKCDTILTTQELICISCGEHLIFRKYEHEYFAQRGWSMSKRCPTCRKKAQAMREKEIERIENNAWQQKKAEEKKLFETLLKEWPVISKDDIQPENDHVLYIIGNGFDLMHNVKSSYYAFRDSLGKQNSLRFALENFLTSDDIWADFENALAHFDMRTMGSQFIVDDWLDNMGAYDEDAGAAEFYMAIEAAANPIQTIINDFPRRFRMWVETLSIGTEDRPLQKMFRNGKVLCFNYTEFAEKLYGISEENICYIHGCRRKKKFHRKDVLVLGHMPGASDDAFDFEDSSYIGTKNIYKQEMIQAAQENVLRLIMESDEELTKDCKKIITDHKSFFRDLNEIETVIVIGHSFSPTDWDYFSEVTVNLSDCKNTHWYFGCYGLRDLQNLEQMLKTLNIQNSCISIFRTDEIYVRPLSDKKAKKQIENSLKEKIRCISSDGRWMVKTSSGRLSIIDQEHQIKKYEVLFSAVINHVFFFPSEKYLSVIIRGVYPGVFLFHLEDTHWSFVNELESIPNQSVLNRRLQHIFLTDTDITFVYNNRVRKYILSDGTMIENRRYRNARNRSYKGECIDDLFL